MSFAASPCVHEYGVQEGVVAQVAQHGYVTPCQRAVLNGQSCMQGFSPNGQGFMAPNGQGFMPSPNGQGFMPSPNGQGFMPSPNGNNFMTPNGQGFMPSPNGQGFMPSPHGQGFMPSPYGQGFMPSPNGNNFMPSNEADMSPNGQGFMPSPNGNFAQPNGQSMPLQCFAPNFVQQPDSFVANGEVSEKVLNWLSQKALEKLGEVLADEADAESDAASEAEAEDVYSGLLADLRPGSVASTAQAILRVHSAAGTEALAAALVARAVSEPTVQPLACANLLCVVLERLPAGHRREAVCGPASLTASVVQRCHEQLEDVDTEDVHEAAHGTAVFLGELYKRSLVGMGEVKELFGRLAFSEDRPLDHCASLACHLFLTVGPFLERSEAGRKLSECMCARLRELKGINFSEATLFSLKQVTDLKLNKWVPKKQAPVPKAKKQVKRASAPDSHDEKVLLIGRLFTEQRVATTVVKELFQQLLFTESVAERRVELARQLLSRVGPTLEASKAGRKLVEFVVLRLRELSVDADRGAATPHESGMAPRAFTFRAQACAAC